MIKDLVFLPTRRKKKRNALAHLHIWLPAHTQSQHLKAAKRANRPARIIIIILISKI
jgi:hypothetical protein